MALFFDEAELDDLLAELRGKPAMGGADEELARVDRRARGVFFTPAPLVDFVTRKLAENLEPSDSIRILDPAAGDGRFLRSLIRSVAAGEGAPIRMEAVGLERDAKLCRLAQTELPDSTMLNCEALIEAPDLGEFDLVVGNPPYIRSIRLGETDPDLREALRGRYHGTSHGEWDLYGAFIEKSFQWLAPNGWVGLVVPSRWLTAAFARELRGYLAEQAAVRAIIDFGSEQLFAGATTYASVVFLSAAGSDELSIARLKGDRFDVGSVAAESLSRSPWRISVGRGRRRVSAMKKAGPPLGEIARIVKGTGTNADSVFVFDGEEGGQSDLEPSASRPCVRGRDVRPRGTVDGSVRCLLPYDENGTLLAPNKLEATFPKAHAYLQQHRETLEARERGRFRGPRFYQFGRPQNLALLLEKRAKIIVPDITREGRAMVDRGGALVLDSAYVVIPNREEDLESILAALNSAAVRLWLAETGIPLRGGYVRMKTDYLKSLPIPLGAGDFRCAYGVSVADWAPRETK